MPPATQPAVTQASPILFGCRVHDGQVISDEDLHEGGLLAGRVALERGYASPLGEGPALGVDVATFFETFAWISGEVMSMTCRDICLNIW